LDVASRRITETLPKPSEKLNGRMFDFRHFSIFSLNDTTRIGTHEFRCAMRHGSCRLGFVPVTTNSVALRGMTVSEIFISGFFRPSSPLSSPLCFQIFFFFNERPRARRGPSNRVE
jgi:hypothetical protein